jgi:hypothetical protein
MAMLSVAALLQSITLATSIQFSTNKFVLLFLKMPFLFEAAFLFLATINFCAAELTFTSQSQFRRVS